MKNVSLYSNRFRILEILGYFILLLPWLTDFLTWSSAPYGASTLAIKLLLSAYALVFIAMLRDVRMKISSLDILKQDLSMAAIHDLKGPLTSIIGSLSLISEPDIDPVAKERLLKVAADSSQAMIRLIQTLIDTERMEIAEIRLRREVMDPRSHITECLKPFLSTAEAMGINLQFSFDKGLSAIRADKDLLGRVYENLLINAFKYSHRGGTITISARLTDGNYYFEVKDTGAGIPAAFIDKIFGKFYRVEAREQDSCAGSGLGLYFCRLAVEAHGGKISIESKIGEGTRVFFEIPQKTEAPRS